MKVTFQEAIKALQENPKLLMIQTNKYGCMNNPYHLNGDTLCGLDTYPCHITTNLILSQWEVYNPKPTPEELGFIKAMSIKDSIVEPYYFKPVKVEVWINVYYNYKENDITYLHFNTAPKAYDADKLFSDLVFIKTCHLVQQLSIPYKEV